MLNRRKKAAPGRISVDLGGYHTRIFTETDGLILDEPSIGLLDMDHQETGARAVSDYGTTAAERFANAPAGKRLISPLQSDCINNVGHCPKMLQYFLQRVKQQRLICKSPIVLLALPGDINELQTDQLRHACFTAGASRVHLVDNGIATALGAGLPVDQPEPSMVIDFGARNARLYAFANNEIIASAELPCGGDLLNQKLADGIRERFGIHITESTATETKHRVGSAMPASYSHRLRNSCQVQGLAIDENFDTQFSLSTEIACEILHPTMMQAANVIGRTVDKLSPYLTEISENGIILTGGGSQLTQVDQLVMEASNLPVEIANRPLSTAVRGGGLMLERIHGSLSMSDQHVTAASA